MSVAFKLKRSSISGRAPDTSSIDYGELAVNTYDGVIYFKKNDGNGDSVTSIRQVTEYNLAVDNTPITNSSSNNLSGVLRDLDRAINQNKTFTIGADDSTLVPVGPGESVSFLGGNNIETTSDVEGNITIALNTSYTFPVADGSNGQVLVTDGQGNLTFTTFSGSGGASTLDGLLDVDTNGAQSGDALVYDGNSWIASTPSAANVADISTVSATDDIFALALIMG